MRYALIGIAAAGALSLGWLATNAYPGYGDILWPPALVLGLAAIGMTFRQAWAAYLLSVGAFLTAALLVLLMMFLGPGNFRDQPAGGFSWGWLILWGLLALALTVGGMGIALGGRLRRKRRERAVSEEQATEA